ncbi:hypothetical protein C8039_11785 [Halogeometricum sp. wsp3]|nr:hypothetical protein C8039_11785 [Halogeometricum sp. wsp3]
MATQSCDARSRATEELRNGDELPHEWHSTCASRFLEVAVDATRDAQCSMRWSVTDSVGSGVADCSSSLLFDLLVRSDNPWYSAPRHSSDTTEWPDR